VSLFTVHTLVIDAFIKPLKIMNQEDYRHPIAPPPELVENWIAQIWHEGTPVRVAASDMHVATRAAQWGADQELEACCLWVNSVDDADCFGANLRTARRPKPPSLKEQALEALDRMDQFPNLEDRQIVRRALEQLDD
jgi:hypothetical protein